MCGKLSPGGRPRSPPDRRSRSWRRSASARARDRGARRPRRADPGSPERADAAERLGGGTLQRGPAGAERVTSCGSARVVTPETRRVKRGVTHALVAIVQRDADRLARRRAVDARQRPDRVAPRFRRRDRRRTSASAGTAASPAFPSGAAPGSARPARIVQQPRQIGGRHRGPREASPARIGGCGAPFRRIR